MTDDTIEKLAFLLLGWLLGLLGPVIVESIKRKRENAMGRAAILNELHELVGVLSIAAYGARMRHGSADRRFLEWLKGTLEQYATTTKLQEFIPRIRHWLSLTDDQLHQVARHTSASDGKRAMLQHYPVPLIDARVSAIWSFDTSFQRQLLAIRRNMAILDDVVDRSRTYFDMTFTKLEDGNYALIDGNLTQTYEVYAERAEIIVDLIRGLTIARE